jgi:hypothetical protein
MSRMRRGYGQVWRGQVAGAFSYSAEPAFGPLLRNKKSSSPRDHEDQCRDPHLSQRAIPWHDRRARIVEEGSPAIEWFVARLLRSTFRNTPQGVAARDLPVHAAALGGRHHSFFPLLAAATGDRDLLSDAAREYATVMALIDEIAYADPENIHPITDPVYALARVLERHISAAEEPRGLFDRARASSMDCESAGESMRLRRSELLRRSRWQ